MDWSPIISAYQKIQNSEAINPDYLIDPSVLDPTTDSLHGKESVTGAPREGVKDMTKGIGDLEMPEVATSTEMMKRADAKDNPGNFLQDTDFTPAVRLGFSHLANAQTEQTNSKGRLAQNISAGAQGFQTGMALSGGNPFIGAGVAAASFGISALDGMSDKKKIIQRGIDENADNFMDTKNERAKNYGAATQATDNAKRIKGFTENTRLS